MHRQAGGSTIGVPGYTLTEVEEDSPQLIVWRGHLDSDTDRRPLVLKHIKLNPTDKALARSEFQKVQHLTSDNLLKVYDVIDSPEGLILVLEDPSGVPLSLFWKSGALDTETALKITIQLADALQDLHRHDLLHRNVRPCNILIDPQKGTVKLGGFGVFSVTKGGAQSPADMLREILAYGSPEQTGRMNRSVDYRTDFYSLGVTLYEMLTGRVPFESTDPLELLHSHIAKKPVHPTEVNPGIPRILGDIVMRLLAKNAEDRYQTGHGLEADLIACLEQWQRTGCIQSFALGAHDISDRFQIPQKLYGREREIEILTRAFERVCQGENELMLVAGRPGIGKSVLVREVHKPIVARRGYFISGKYEQLRRDEPYSAILQAFRELVRQILSESEERIRIWRDSLLAAVGPNGRVITDVIPNVELIIGRQPEIPKLGPEESRNRFNIVFERFVGVFSKEDHPVVLFLDDLQWADLASLKMMTKMLTSPETSHLLIIGAYRDNEVTDTHPLIDTLKEIEKSDVRVKTITLSPLSTKDVNSLVADFLRCPEERGAELGELVYRKTGGNPFFVNQFLKTLYDEGMIHLDPQEGWQWDVEKTRQMHVTDNLVELLIEKINRFPEGTREALKACACIGNRFDLETVSHLMGKSLDESLQDLSEAMKEGLIEVSENTYFYHHDRIQEAAYSLLPKEEKGQLHYRIGNLALERTDATELKDKLFYIVDQLNCGSECITDQKEKEDLARLNLEAGKKAKSSVAYLPAFRYLAAGMSLLERDCWESQYDLALDIHNQATEIAYLKGDFEQMNAMADIVIEKARTLVDRTGAYGCKLMACKAQQDFPGALRVGLIVLKLSGIELRIESCQTAIVEELGKAMAALSKKTDEDLLNQHDMTDPEMISAVQILATLQAAAFHTNRDISVLVALKSVNIFITHGNHPLAACAYAGYGAVLLCGLGDIKGGYRFGKLAFKIIEKYNATELKPPTICNHNILIRHWNEHLRESLSSAFEGYQIGIETGSLEYAAWNLALYDIWSLSVDIEGGLTRIAEEMGKHGRILHQLKNEPAVNLHAIYRQFALNLLGENDDPVLHVGEAFDERQMAAELLRAKNFYGLATLYGVKSQLLNTLCEYHQAFEFLEQAEKLRDSARGTTLLIIINLVGSLVRLQIYPEVSKEEQEQFLKAVEENQQAMKKWAEITPVNFLHRFYMVEAERAKVAGDVLSAMDSYDKAIELSHNNGYLSDEALANELAAKFYLSRGKETIARVYMTQAHACYSRWGANAKVKQLEETYSGLLSSIARSPEKESSETSGTATSIVTSDKFDLSSVMKASQTISGEIMLGKLLVKMMKIVMQNAGAEKGYMILEDNGQLLVEAEGAIGQEETSVLKSIPVDGHQGLSSSIVNYVARTKEMLILNDATSESNFADDPYVVTNKPKSILCSPILNQGRLTGILYLENNLSTHAFTPERLGILNMLSSQMAISIENAKLYENLEEKVEQRTLDLAVKNTQVETARQELVELNNTLEEKVQERTAQVQKLLTQKDVFISQLGHDLKSPLTPLVTLLPMLKDDLQEEERDEIVNVSIANVGYMRDLVDKTLKLAKLTSLEMKPITAGVKVRQQLQVVLNVRKRLAESKSVTIETLVDDGIVVQLEETNLQELFDNLIVNAIRFTPEGGSITIDAVVSEPFVTMSVKDTGLGMNEEQMSHIFEEFYKADPSRHDLDSSGLGLTICKRIVEQYGGNIWAESEGLGKGSAFYFTLRLAERTSGSTKDH